MQTYIKEKFIKFLEQKIPQIIENYKVIDDHVLIDVFKIEPEKKSPLAGPVNLTQTDLGFTWTTIARVVSENTCGYKIGDIVKLSDYKVATFTGIDHEQWTSLSEKGSIRKIGEAPPKKITRFYEAFMRFTFNPYPIIGVNNNMNLFLVPKHEIVSKVNSPHDLVNF